MGQPADRPDEGSLEDVISIEPNDEAALIRHLFAATPQKDSEASAQERLLEFADKVPHFFEGRLERLMDSYKFSIDYYRTTQDLESANLYISELEYLSWLVERLQNEYAFAMMKTGEQSLVNKFLIVGYEPGKKQTDSHVFGIAVSPRDYAQVFSGETKFDSYVLVLHSYRGKNSALRCRGLIANAPKYARALLEQKDDNVPMVFPSIEALAQAP